MNRKQRSYIFTVVLLLVTIYTIWPKAGQPELMEIRGTTMGTIAYTVKVIGQKDDLKEPIDSILVAFNQSLSTYIPDSEISRFNRESELTDPSRLFNEVLQESLRIYDLTGGAFDPTVGPLVNAWGFGPDKKIMEPDSAMIDSLLLLIGYEKLSIRPDRLAKEAGVTIDFSAIAKGQAVDEVGRWLEDKGYEDYMVEIGGEVRCRGLNLEGNTWRIGIQDPRIAEVNDYLAIVKVDSMSLATSGNYRNYYEKDGKTRAHIVSPITGYTSQHNLLSASVFHPNCMTADAFATAFMVMGLERSIEMVERDKHLEAIFIFQSGEEFDIYVSAGLEQLVEMSL